MRLPLKSRCDVFWRLKLGPLSKFYFKHVLIPSSSSATRTLSFLGHWQVSAGTSGCVSSPHLSAGGSPLPQALLPAVPQLLQLTDFHLSSEAPAAAAKLPHWAFSWSSEACAPLGNCSAALTNRKHSPSLRLSSSKRAGSFSFKELAVVPNGGHEILETSEAF